MRVLVTGGSGFIGSHVVDKLCGHGMTVRVFDAVAPNYRNDVEFHQGDVLRQESLRSALGGVDVVVHLAAVADVREVFAHPLEAEEVNVRGTVNVLEAMRRVGPKRVLYASTVWVYSDCEGAVVDESTPIAPPSHLYTATKYASELYCQAYAKLYGIEFTIMRFGVPYGPRAREGAVVPTFVKKALAGEPLTIAGDGSQFRRFIYVEDLAEGVVMCLKPAARNRIFNLDGSEKVTVAQIAEAVKKVVGNVTIEYGSARPGDFGGKDVLSDRARKELGWEPRVPFEAGVRRYVDWYRQRECERSDAWARVDATLRA